MPTAHAPPLPWAGAWADAVPDPDADLLRRFASDRDASAFAVLVRRYAGLVLGVCGRVAGHRQDAEDAFQATFLLLARKAATLRTPHLLGNWLYGVAYRVARKARRTTARRRTREAAMPDTPPMTARPAADMSDLAPVIDEELAMLGEHHRSAVVLCDVQGLSRAVAAEKLGIAEGTLSSRLNAARKKLAERLQRRGVGLGGIALGLLAAETAVSDDLLDRLNRLLTVELSGGDVPAPIGQLLHEGWTMRTKFLLGTLGVVAAGAIGLALAAQPGEPQKPPTAATPPKAAPPTEEKKETAPSPNQRAKRPKLQASWTIDSPVYIVKWAKNGLILTTALGHEFRDYDHIAVTPEGRRNRALDLSTSFSGNARLIGELEGDRLAFFQSGGNRINSISSVTAYHLSKSRNDGTHQTLPDASVFLSLEKDDGRPVAITPDAKVLMVEHSNTKLGVGSIGAIDAKTGDELRTLYKSEAEKGFVRGYTFSAAVDRLFVYVQREGAVGIQSVDVSTGKPLWDREFEQPKSKHEFGGLRPILVASPDGKTLAWMLGKDPNFNSTGVFLLDARTGKDLPAPQQKEGYRNWAVDFSSDGRLLAGTVWKREGRGERPQGASDQLVVWDTTTGEVLRTWDDPLGARVKFAPDRPLLAIVESETRHIGSDSANMKVSYSSTIGLWDLSPLLKSK